MSAGIGLRGWVAVRGIVVGAAAAGALAACGAGGEAASDTGSASTAPATRYATPVAEACTEAAAAIEAGRLRAAERVLAGPVIEGADPTCVVEATALVADRRAQATALVEAALASPDRGALLAGAALRLDADNAQARALVDSAPLPTPTPARPLPTPEPTPSLTFTPAPVVTPPPDACAGAREALSEGRYTEAGEITGALGDDVTCVAGVKADIAARQAAQPLQRAWRSLADDRLPQLLLAAGLVLVGALVARVSTAGRRPTPGRAGALPAALTGGALLVALLGPALAQLSPGLVEWLPGGAAGVAWDAATAGLAGLFGFLLVRRLRSTAPTMVEVIDSDGKAVANSPFGTLVVSEVSTIADAKPGGVFGVTGGSDLSSDGVTAALDTVTQKYLKAMVTVWRALTTGLGDRVRVSLVGTDDDPVAAVVIRRGSRTVYEERIDAVGLRVDPAKPSDAEKLAVTRDLATAVAARLVLVAVGNLGHQAHVAPPRGLHGVTDPRSLALSAIAARSSRAGRYDDAVELYSRAVGIEPENLVAHFGAAVAVLRRDAAGKDAALALDRLAELGTLLERERGAGGSPTPLEWRVEYNAAVHRINREFADGYPTAASARARVDAQREVLEGLHDRLTGLSTPEADARLKGALADLSRIAALSASCLTVDDARLREVVVALDGVGLNAGTTRLVNAANGYVIAWQRVGGGTSSPYLRKAIRLVRVVGVEESRRQLVVDDPVLALLAPTRDFRTLLQEWGLPKVSYAELTAIGSSAAGRLASRYGSAAALLSAVTKHPQAVCSIAGVRRSVLPWWEGALAWLDAGRDVTVINAYQAAGIRDAAHARSLGDAFVVARLHRRRKDDATLAVPDARTRQLMT